MRKVNHKSLMYQCFYEILCHLALFRFSIWLYIGWLFGIILLGHLAEFHSIEGIIAVIRTFTLYWQGLLPVDSRQFPRSFTSFASHCCFRLPSTVLQHRRILFATLFSLCFTPN